jgi:fatty aldehyde-generating acyl-ACP reductase
LERFGFIIHPIDVRSDVRRKYPIARYLPVRMIEWALARKKPERLSHITGIRSKTGAEAEGWFVACPLTPRQMVEMPFEFVADRIAEAGQIAADLGAGIVGLGAFTAVAGDGGITVAEKLDIAVTTGNSYTVAAAIEGVFEAARMVGIAVDRATAAVVGAGGSIGKTSAQILSKRVAKIILIEKDQGRLAELAGELTANGDCEVVESTDVKGSIEDADMLVTVSSAADAIIEPEYLKRGAVVCDVARPRDVSVRVAKERQDVLVIEGGMIAVPGEPDFGFDFGFPPGTAYACMAETMILALEGRYESYTLGKDVSLAQVTEISGLAAKHGFELAGFRSFERAVNPEQIDQVRKARLA